MESPPVRAPFKASCTSQDQDRTYLLTMADQEGSESEDDAYFEMLAKRSASNGIDQDEESTHESSSEVKPISDADYLEMQSLTESGAFAREDESIWRVFMSAASTGGTADDGNLQKVLNTSFADNMLVVDWLLSQLPRASSLFHLAKGVEQFCQNRQKGRHCRLAAIDIFVRDDVRPRKFL